MIIRQNGKTGVWLRRLDAEHAQFVAGSEGAGPSTDPFWSPDSRHVAFSAPGGVMKYTLNGSGSAELICPYSGSIFGGTWNAAGMITPGNLPAWLSRAVRQVVAHRKWPPLWPPREIQSLILCSFQTENITCMFFVTSHENFTLAA